MKTKPLSLLFDTMHHHKHSFEDFLNLSVTEHSQPVGWRNRTIYKPSRLHLRRCTRSLIASSSVFIDQRQGVFRLPKGATLRDAVTPHAHSRAFYQTDLEKFFDSITETMVRAVINSFYSRGRLAELS